MLPVLAGLLTPLVGQLIDRLFPDPAEREKAKLALIQQEGQQALKEMEVQLSAIVTEAASPDPWTSRARPTFLYVMYAVIGLRFVGGILGIWWPEHATTAAQNIANLLGAIPDDLWWLFGAGYLGYTGVRGFEKMKGLAK